ncbi:MAG: hypothetical protein JW929_00535 [Anaerolineales bacterium]|nr:hypothetical protein [Anaerolineales bacterium]
MADDKALPENMIRADIRTTDDAYAMLSPEEVGKLIAGLFSKGDVQESSATVLENVPNEKFSEMLHELVKRIKKEYYTPRDIINHYS